MDSSLFTSLILRTFVTFLGQRTVHKNQCGLNPPEITENTKNCEVPGTDISDRPTTLIPIATLTITAVSVIKLTPLPR